MHVLVDAHYWCNSTVLTPSYPTLGRDGVWWCSDPTAPNWGICGGDLQCGAGAAVIASATATATAAAPSDLTTATTTAASAAWVMVDVKAGSSPTEVIVDLSKLNGATPIAIRYGWGNDNSDSCCAPASPTEPCVPASCPLWDPSSSLPANPFIARIEGGRCSCVPPQHCDG